MHRATPLNSSFRAYTSGGARGVVDQVDDTKLMQEMAGNFMVNETRSAVESPQNYGFTSVVFDAEKGQDGKIQSSAEHFTSFIGGSRSFPVAIMDDRRHRLYKLEKGDTAMFRGRGDKQQLHMTQDGGFWTAPRNKTVRMQLVDSDSESNATQQQGGQQGSGGVAQADAGGGGGTSGQQSGGQQKRGQTSLYKDGQKSFRYVDVTKDKTTASGTEVHLKDANGATQVQVVSGKVYLGGTSSSSRAAMKPVMLSGEELSSNVFAAGGGGFQPDRIKALTERVAALEAKLESLLAKIG
jgi:phage gp45-like